MNVRLYKVEKGDTPMKIAAKYGVESRWPELVANNPQLPRKQMPGVGTVFRPWGEGGKFQAGAMLRVPFNWPNSIASVASIGVGSSSSGGSSQEEGSVIDDLFGLAKDVYDDTVGGGEYTGPPAQTTFGNEGNTTTGSTGGGTAVGGSIGGAAAAAVCPVAEQAGIKDREAGNERGTSMPDISGFSETQKQTIWSCYDTGFYAHGTAVIDTPVDETKTEPDPVKPEPAKTCTTVGCACKDSTGCGPGLICQDGKCIAQPVAKKKGMSGWTWALIGSAVGLATVGVAYAYNQSSKPAARKGNPVGKGGSRFVPSATATVIHLVTTNDVYGNPRRLFVVLHDNGAIARVVDEGYSGEHALDEAFGQQIGRTMRSRLTTRIEITPAEYKRLRKMAQ